MNKITYLFTHYILPLLVGVTALLLGASSAAASVVTSGDLTVDFEGTGQLFSNTNIAPGESITRTVSVTNTGSATESVYTSVDNEYTTGLADQINLTITATSSGTIYFDDSFTEFFGPDPVFLGTLGAGQTRTYSYTATFNSGASNDYQDKEMGFDLVVGFEGGDSVDDGGGGDGGGGGGGGGITSGGPGNTASGPVPRVAGVSTDSGWPWTLPSGSSLGEAIKGAVGRVLGESISAAEPENGNSFDNGSSENSDTTDSQNCWYWWLLVLLWALVSGVVYYLKGWGDGLVSVFMSQIVFGIIAIAGILAYYLFDQECAFWPSVITLIGSGILYFLNNNLSSDLPPRRVI